MSWLNYHHLHYFWRVAEEGGVQRAARSLRLTHSTLSTQLKQLEGFFGGALFSRQGRTLRLTPLGESVKQVADDIFRLGGELKDLADGKGHPGRRRPLHVGVVDALPKTVVWRLLEPALGDEALGPLVLREDPLDDMLAELVTGRLHVVLADQPAAPTPGLLLRGQYLGESRLGLYATPALARRWGRDFPRGLEGAPLLVPRARTGLRRQLDRWLLQHRVQPRIVGEFDDSATLRTFGTSGAGLFPVRLALKAELAPYDVVPVGPLEGVRERYYAYTAAWNVEHPGVAPLLAELQRDLGPPRGRA